MSWLPSRFDVRRQPPGVFRIIPHTSCNLLLLVCGLLTPTPSVAEPTVIMVADGPAHWSFSPLTRPDAPATGRPGWHRTGVDAFILAKLEKLGLSPMPPAARTTLIRRVTFDLTGLPPTPEEIDAFVRDDTPDAYERLIDRLLASPAYGERWAQHWLDLARFAETDGFEHDLARPNAWRYRDWVIDALNRDMPFDEFVRMQIAGDEIAISLRLGASSAVATGFLLCGPDMPDINLREERRHNVLNEMTATLGSVFLGLQLGCAQCHDHKYDPLTMADFYRLRAFFEPAEFFEETPLASPEELAERERLEAPAKTERQRIDQELKRFDAVAHERLNKDPQVKISRDELVSALSETEKETFQKLTDELKRLPATNLPPLAMGRVLREIGGTPPASHIMLRGDFRQPGPRVTPGYPAVANPWHAPVQIPESATPSSGRRMALADWLTRPDHPLTTRVIVNRIWQFHFGQGLVRTPSDFGTQGERPSHPDLLDWLATEFTRPVDQGGCGWSLKRLHRLLLASATYMQASRPTEPDWTAQEQTTALDNWRRARALDPENRWLARMNRLRLDGESIRDAMLAASDRLGSRRGGPGVRPPLPGELVATLLKGQWVVSPDEEDHRRRSIYLFVRRNLRYPLFEAFDRPDTNASCPQRPRSTTALQSLTLLNSEFTLEAATDLANLVLAKAGESSEDQINLVFLRTLGRAATDDETRMYLELIPAQAEGLRQEPKQTTSADSAALTDLGVAVFNLNEFIYLD